MRMLIAVMSGALFLGCGESRGRTGPTGALTSAVGPVAPTRARLMESLYKSRVLVTVAQRSGRLTPFAVGEDPAEDETPSTLSSPNRQQDQREDEKPDRRSPASLKPGSVLLRSRCRNPTFVSGSSAKHTCPLPHGDHGAGGPQRAGRLAV
jgi:hypothetical protein